MQKGTFGRRGELPRYEVTSSAEIRAAQLPGISQSGPDELMGKPASGWRRGLSSAATFGVVLLLSFVAFGTIRNYATILEERTKAAQVTNVAPPETGVTAPMRAKPEECGATMAEFKALKTGMSLNDATRVIGCAGEEISRVAFDEVSTVMLTWRGTDTFIGNMNATFQGGRLIAKAQIGLR